MIINTHLFLKIPDGKPPFIGIAFEPDSGMGSLKNQDLPGYKNREVSILIRRSALSVGVIVMIKGLYHTYGYQNVSYSPGELDAWLRACKDAKKINFGHVTKHDFGHVICHTHADNKAFFLQLDKLIVVDEANSAVVVKNP